VSSKIVSRALIGPFLLAIRSSDWSKLARSKQRLVAAIYNSGPLKPHQNIDPVHYRALGSATHSGNLVIVTYSLKTTSISSGVQLPNMPSPTNHSAIEQHPLRKCAGRCHRELPLSEFVNLRDPTKTTQRCLLCRDSSNAEVTIYRTLLYGHY